MNQILPRFIVCRSEELLEGRHLILKLVFEGREDECVVLRYQGKAYAYINRCVHMPRRLDCEEDVVFDQTGRYLRCSMHGIVYTPETGTSVSTMCEGQRLCAIDIDEADDAVGIIDFRVSSIGR